MKKAVNISIAQTLFTIEEDAFAKLDDYLKSIKKHFANTEDNKEIIADIEARISEQFLETKKKIITFSEVEMVIESMGKVEDFENDDEEEPQKEPTRWRDKKLYRDPEGKVVAGVCSGFGIYFNIDPVWLRILFVIFIVVTYGFGIILYLLLVLIIPKAKTASQKLEMEGTPVTLGTMSENFREKAVKFQKKNEPKIRAALEWPFKVLKQLIDFLMAFLLPIIRVLVGLFLFVFSLGTIVMGSIFASLLLSNGEAYLGLPINEILTKPILYLTVISIYLAALIPLIALVIFSIIIIRKKNMMSMTLGLSLLFVWCATVAAAGFGGVSTANSFEFYMRDHELFKNVNREITISEDITNLNISDMKLKLVQGPEAKLLVTGTENQVKAFKPFDTGKDSIALNRPPNSGMCLFCNYGEIEGTLTLPNLESVFVYGGAHVNVDEWKSDKPLEFSFFDYSDGNLTLQAPQVKILATNSTHLTLNLDTPTANLTADNSASIEVLGKITQAELKAEYSSSLDLKEAEVESVKVHTDSYSMVWLPMLKTMEVFADHMSQVSFKESAELYGGAEKFEDSPNVKIDSRNGSNVNTDTVMEQMNMGINDQICNEGHCEYDVYDYDQPEIPELPNPNENIDEENPIETPASEDYSESMPIEGSSEAIPTP